MKCKNCGTELLETSEFCHKCGKRIKDEDFVNDSNVNKDNKGSRDNNYIKKNTDTNHSKSQSNDSIIVSNNDDSIDETFLIEDKKSNFKPSQSLVKDQISSNIELFKSRDDYDKEFDAGVFTPTNVEVLDPTKHPHKKLIIILCFILFIGIIAGVFSYLFLNGTFTFKDQAGVTKVEKTNNINNENAKLYKRVSDKNTNEKGVELLTEIETTNWIKGSDSNAIMEAWNLAGGTEDAPDVNSFNNANPKTNNLSFDNCAVLVGCVSFNNLKNNEIKLDSYTNEVKAYISINSENSYNDFNIKTVFSPKKEKNSQKLKFGNLIINSNQNTLIINDQLKENPYGPCPFMIVAYDVFVKDQLLKNLSFDNLNINIQFFAGSLVDYIGDKKTGYLCTFKADKSW